MGSIQHFNSTRMVSARMTLATTTATLLSLSGTFAFNPSTPCTGTARFGACVNGRPAQNALVCMSYLDNLNKPASSYSAPSYSAPAPSYSAPAPAGAPNPGSYLDALAGASPMTQSYSAPAPSYSAPAPAAAPSSGSYLDALAGASPMTQSYSAPAPSY